MGNPYTIIAALVIAIGLFGTGARIGYKYSEGEHARVTMENANAAADAARIAAKTESDAALAVVQKQAASRAKARDAQHKLELELAKDEAARNCRVSAGTFSVLQQSAAAANAQTLANRVDGADAGISSAGKPQGGGLSAGLPSGGGGLRGVPVGQDLPNRLDKQGN